VSRTHASLEEQNSAKEKKIISNFRGNQPAAMLSKARFKYVKSLQIKKYREAEQRFTVEGAKSVLELLQSDFHTELLIGTTEFFSRSDSALTSFPGERMEVKSDVLASLGSFKTNDTVLAVARMKGNEIFTVSADEFALVLDDIRDPGNLGTIIRIADWYGITKIIASNESTDFYNPKTLHASMGSFTRVSVFYTALTGYLPTITLPVWGACMEGEDVHQVQWGNGGLLVIGNEAHGISGDVMQHLTHRVTIPRYGKAESLNAAIATAILCDNLRR
jgi:TrmH family RNA methyltransferase